MLLNDLPAETVYHMTGAEPVFEGHFPGVLMVESMAQAARIALAAHHGIRRAGFLAGIDKVRFNKPVVPPQDLRIVARLEDPGPATGPGFASAKCTAFVGTQRAARADILLSIREG